MNSNSRMFFEILFSFISSNINTKKISLLLKLIFAMMELQLICYQTNNEEGKL